MKMQQGLVLDAVGAAVRGDRPALVLYQEVSRNISNWTNNNTRNNNSEKASLDLYLHTCCYKVCA